MPEIEEGGKTAEFDRDGGELRLTDEGLEMPEMLRGYVGQFEMKTPNVTGQFNTTDVGLPDVDFYDGPIAAMPESGDYHENLDAGEMVLQVRGHPATKFTIVDEQTGV